MSDHQAMAANGPPNDQALKLSARDEADLDVLSSLLQDAAVPVADMAYFPEQRRFALVASRFRWEQDGRRAAEAAGSRITCGLRVEGVRRAALHGIDRKHPDEVLELSAIRRQDGCVMLIFAGGAMVRLEVDGILCHLEDFGLPWPTMFRPDHGLDRADQN